MRKKIDRENFRRVIINLFSNACQAMIGENQNENEKKSGKTLELKIESRVKDNMVSISISDTGTGIPDDMIQKIVDMSQSILT